MAATDGPNTKTCAKVEVRYANLDEKGVGRLLRLSKDFIGTILEELPKRKSVFIKFYRDGVFWKEFPGNLSYTSLYWKMHEMLYGKSETLKKRAISKHRDQELEEMKRVCKES